MTANKSGKAIIFGNACNSERMYRKKEIQMPNSRKKICVFFIKSLLKSFFS